MSKAYQENGFIFLTSTDRKAPHGRNVRVNQRCQSAAPARQQEGQFIVFKSRPRKISKETTTEVQQDVRNVPRKKIKRSSKGKRELQLQLRLNRSPSLSPDHKVSLDFSNIKPNEVLAIAACHIRRLATINLRSDTPRILDGLRCRQWSFISLLRLENYRKTPYLAGAVICVAAKLRQIVFNDISPLLVFSLYDKALHCLQDAVQGYHNANDDSIILTAIQLLAIFEMLDGPENTYWRTHIVGAQHMIQTQLSNPARITRCQLRPFLQTAPMFTDALLEYNREYFEKSPWRILIRTVILEQFAMGHQAEELIQCFYELPELLAEANQPDRDFSMNERLSIMARAQVLKRRLKIAVDNNEESLFGVDTQSPRFDVLGLSLAGLIALDRIIATIMPDGHNMRGLLIGRTDEVCLQMFQAELAVSDASRISWLRKKDSVLRDYSVPESNFTIF